MKIKNILAITALVGFSASVQAAPIVFDFLSDGANVTLGNSHTFTQGGASLTAYASGNEVLFAKSQGAGETGLGINSDPSGQHEIYGSTFIQLLSVVGGSGFTISSIDLGSVTAGEVANVYYSSTLGVLGTLIGSVNSITSFAIASQYQNGYIGVQDAGNVSNPNVLLGPVTGFVPDGGTTVAMLGGALTALGLIRRKLVA